MRFFNSRSFTGSLLLASLWGTGFCLCCAASAQTDPQPPPPPPAVRGRSSGGDPDGDPGRRWAATAGGTFATVTGTISQFNYDQEAEVEGFLLSNNSLVQLPRGIAAKVVPSLPVGDSVTVAGMARTSTSGFQTIAAQSIKDTTSGKSFEIPTPGAPAPLAGSGKIQQLNYGRGGEVNGFLLDNGVLAMVPPFSGSNPSSIKVGGTVAYSGYARRTMSDKTVVTVQSLTINGQQITLAPAGRSRGFVGPRGPGSPPPAPRGAASPDGPGPPPGHLEEPPPPPPPSPAREP
jgi:hypothetical protein